MLKLPHDERVAVLRDPAARAEMRDRGRELQPRSREGHHVPPPLWNAVYVDEVHAARAREVPVALDRRRRRASSASRPPTRCSTSRSTRTSPREFRWRTESPEWTAAVGEAQLDPRMIIGISDGGAHLARDDGADWSSYFLRSWVLDRKVWTLEEGIRQITQVPAALARPRRPRRASRPARPADLMVFDPDDHRPVEEGVRARPPRRRRAVQGVGQGRAGDHRERRADRAATASSPAALPGQVVRPG